MSFRIFGEDLSSEKIVKFALTKVFGIGIKRSEVICKALDISDRTRVKELADIDSLRIQDMIRSLDYLVASDLKRKILNDNRRLSSIRCYRWLCRERGIPCHGQRSRSNGNTAARNKRKA